MKSINIGTFAELTRGLETFVQRQDLSLDDRVRAAFLKVLAPAENDCVECGFVASTVTVRRILSWLNDPRCEPDRLRALSIELQDRLRDEMSHGREFFVLSLEETQQYRRWWKGWEEISTRFLDTLSDIEEASKCFALSRYAAAVFHSLQIVEIGLLDLGVFMSVPDPRSGWTAVANELKRIVSKKHEDRSAFERKHFEFLEQVQGTVEALKNAWRNKISHTQGKLVLMTRDFSPEVAQEILFASRAFMRRLATDLPKPSA